MRDTNVHNPPDSGSASFKTRLPLLGTILVVVSCALILTAVVICIGYYLVLRPSTRLDGIENRDRNPVEVVKIALTVVGGLGGAAALTVAFRKQKVAERQHELSEADANRQDRRILDERFRNAVQQLGEKGSAAVRIGGAYSLAKLADDWLPERQTCINVLCGYLRFPYGSPDDVDDEREVRKTISDIIRQHLSRDAEVSWDGNLFDLTGATLNHFNFSDIYLTESTLCLRGCVIQEATFNMRGFRVMGGVIDARDLRVMDGATLDAQGGYISDSGKISLVGSVISSGIATFEGTYISGGFLELNKAKIDGSSVLNLSRLQITTVPRGQERLSPLKLDEAEISGGTVNLERIRITKGADQVESIWSGGKERGEGQFLASLRKLVINDGRVSFKDTKIPFGELSFICGKFFGGVLDFECAKLEDCYLNFTGGEIKGGCLNFSNSFIGVPLYGDVITSQKVCLRVA